MIYAEVRDKLKEKSKEEIIDEFIELLKKKDKLERELKKYKNSNTPSSANKHLKEDTQGLKARHGAKRGAPIGHRGDTSHLPSPSELIPVVAENCIECKSLNIEPTGYIKRRLIICYQKAKVVVKQYNQVEYRCLDCPALFLAQHKDIPAKGKYDKSIISLVNFYKFKARMPHGILTQTMNDIHGIPMTDPTSLAIITRTADQLEPEYNKLQEEIRKSEVVNADETSHSVNGKNNWIWVFCNTLLTFFKFNKERGGDIVERVLGKDFVGKLVVDGWRTYKVYSEENDKVLLQRCLAHGEREVEYECKKYHSDLYGWFCDIYSMAKKGKRFKRLNTRQKKFEECKTQLSYWIECAKKRRSLRKLATKIENGGDFWFTGVLYPEVPLDNNEAERSIRPFVIMRKIIGCLRSEIGVRNHEIMMSLISTWEKQQRNAFYTLQQMI
jgi:transposase